MKPCVELKSYAENSGNVIFQTKMCGEIMRTGTADQDVCTLPRLSKRTEIIFIVSLCVIGLNLFIALCVLGVKDCLLAISYFGWGVVFFCATIAAAMAGAICFGTLGVNVFAVSIFTLLQSVVGSFFIGMAMYQHNTCQSENPPKEQPSGNANNEEPTVERTIGEHTLDEENKPMKEIISNFDSDDEHKFEVGVWEEDRNDHAFEVGSWEDSSASDDDYSKFIEVEYMPNRNPR
jgi:hypothetical protein